MTIEASQWRGDLARQIAPLYAQYPKVAAVILGGSGARGDADRYSDLDMGVFWHDDPSEADRQAVVDATGGDLQRLYAYDPDEQVWSDDYYLGRDTKGTPKSGILVEVSHYTSAVMEATLNKVLVEYDTGELAHNLIAGVVDGKPLYGDSLIEGWQAVAATYPDELAAKWAFRYGIIDHFWRWRIYLDRGENLPLLYESFAYVHKRVLYMLLALNRIYYHGFKRVDVLVERFTIKPDDLLGRMQSAYRVTPGEGAQLVITLVDKTFDLVERHLPDVNVDRLREIFHYQRPIWDNPPIKRLDIE